MEQRKIVNNLLSDRWELWLLIILMDIFISLALTDNE